MPTLAFLLILFFGGAFQLERLTFVAAAEPRVQPLIRLGVDTFTIRFDGREGIEIQTYAALASGFRFRRAWTIVAPNGQVASEDIEVSLDNALNVTHARRALRLGAQERRTDVSYANGRADGTLTTASGTTGSSAPIRGVLSPYSTDAAALYPRIVGRSWSVGESDTLRLWDPISQRMTMQPVAAVGRSVVNVGSTQIPALKLEMRTTGLPVVIWLSETRPHRWLRDSSASGGSQLRSR